MKMAQQRRYSLSLREGVLVAKAAVAIGAFRLLLVFVPFRQILRFVDHRDVTSSQHHGDDLAYARQVAWAVRAIARRTLGDKPCLVQSLAAKWLLRKTGHASVLQIGVAKDEHGKLMAHAWLERNGLIIIGGGRSPFRYAPLSAVRLKSSEQSAV